MDDKLFPQPPGETSFVAIGDSFTEGLNDAAPGGGFRGWADRLAGMLAAEHSGLLYANLAVRGKLHGYEIADNIQRTTDDVLQVEEGSLYPALQRMLLKGWVIGEWGVTAGNRRARYYSLTPAGKKQLGIEVSQFQRVMGAITRVIQTI